MSELSPEQLEEVATQYEALLVPALFAQFAESVAGAANVGPGQVVLDVACGTGALTRTVARRVAPGGSVVGVDANPGMLSAARKMDESIEWREANAEALPFEEASFDAVVSQFGLMLFPDPESALREMWRVLKPGGHLAVAVFDSLERLPVYAAMSDVFEKQVGMEVGNTLRFPFSMGQEERLRNLAQAAGVTNAVVITTQGVARFPDTRGMVMSDVRGWFPFAGIQLEDEIIDRVVMQAEEVLVPWRQDDGAVEFPVTSLVITATR